MLIVLVSLYVYVVVLANEIYRTSKTEIAYGDTPMVCPNTLETHNLNFFIISLNIN